MVNLISQKVWDNLEFFGGVDEEGEVGDDAAEEVDVRLDARVRSLLPVHGLQQLRHLQHRGRALPRESRRGCAPRLQAHQVRLQLLPQRLQRRSPSLLVSWYLIHRSRSSCSLLRWRETLILHG